MQLNNKSHDDEPFQQDIQLCHLISKNVYITYISFC